MTSLHLYLWVALGGALGACARHLLTQLTVLWLGKGFPFGTLLVNVVGAFLAGVGYALFAHGWLPNSPWRALISTGLLGAFTTFSTFSLDAVLLLQQGAWAKVGLYITCNVGCCLLLAWLGMQVVKTH